MACFTCMMFYLAGDAVVIPSAHSITLYFVFSCLWTKLACGVYQYFDIFSNVALWYRISVTRFSISWLALLLCCFTLLEMLQSFPLHILFMYCFSSQVKGYEFHPRLVLLHFYYTSPTGKIWISINCVGTWPTQGWCFG